MAAYNEEVTDTIWEEIKSLAVERQQCVYELLSDCIEYKFNEHKYLQQNIGYALYGSPMSSENADTTEINSCYWKPEDSNDTDADITDAVNYSEKAKCVIDVIYNKICEYSIEINNTQSIYFGIIYNIIFRPKINIKSKKKEKVEKEAKKETKTEVKEEKESAITLIPIFKIRSCIQKISNSAKSSEQKENTKTKVERDYETWYIDISGRVYKSWEDYIKNNNLPKCTMVLPKDGFYQADLSYPVTEDYSTVWLDVIDSPACKLTAKICTGIDVVSGIAGIGTVGLSVAALVTPLAPVVAISGLVAVGASSIWTIGRSAQQLVDRKSHEESIHILNKEALSHWLGIATPAFSLGTFGGSAALSSAAASGKTIPNFAKVAFNTVQGGNLLLTGAGIAYQSYYMIDKYWTDKTVSSIDALNLAIHVMFFTGNVMNIQFANDIIKSTQGKVINDYKDTLRKKNLRKKFNRAVRNAVENNDSKISENTEVIRHIRNREQILSANQSTNQSIARNQILGKTSCNTTWSFEQGKLKVNGITLLDPIEYVIRLIKSGIFNENYQNNSSGFQNYIGDTIADQLVNTFSELLTKFYTSNACPKSSNLPIIPDFEPLLKDMSLMKIDEESLKKIFKVVKILMQRSRDKEDFLLMAFAFVWQYCKANLKQWGISSNYRMQSSSGSNILQKIIIAISEAIDIMINNFCGAFAEYVEANVRK